MRRLIWATLLCAGALRAQVAPPPIQLTAAIGAGGQFAILYPVAMTITDANHVMTYPETSAAGLLQVGSSVPLTAVRTITALSVFGECYDVENSTTGGFSIIIAGSSGTGPTIPNGKAIRACYDGSNYVAMGTITLGATPISPGTPVGTVAGLTSFQWSNGSATTTVTPGAEVIDLYSAPNSGLVQTGLSTYGTHGIITDRNLGNSWYYGVDGYNQANFTGDYCLTHDSTWATCDLAVVVGGILPAHIYSQLNCAYVQTAGNPAQCSGETNGSSLILAGYLNVTINSSAVTAGSQIFIQPSLAIAGRFPGGSVTCNSVAGQGTASMYESARVAGVSFTVTSTASSIATNPACFSWMIVN